MSILGIGGATTFSGCKYGTSCIVWPGLGVPQAAFKLNRTVTNETSVKNPEIRNVLPEDTSYTNEEGKIMISRLSFRKKIAHLL